MTIQLKNQWFKVATKAECPWIKGEAAVFKRVGPFNWEDVGVEFESLEDAKEYLKFHEVLNVA